MAFSTGLTYLQNPEMSANLTVPRELSQISKWKILPVKLFIAKFIVGVARGFDILMMFFCVFCIALFWC